MSLTGRAPEGPERQHFPPPGPVDMLLGLLNEEKPEGVLRLVKPRASSLPPVVLEIDYASIERRLLEPFCACGRVVSECDGSRKGCQTP